MTVSELKKKVAESDVKGWFQSLTLTLHYPYLKYQTTLTGIASIYDFVSKQLKGFAELGILSAEIQRSQTAFENLKIAIIQLVNDEKENVQKWNTSTSTVINANQKIFPSDAPETEFLINLHQNFRQYYKPAYNFITGNLSSISKEEFIGYLLVYEFTNRESSKIVERREAEKKSLIQIKSDFKKTVSDSETQIAEYLSNANDAVVEKSKQIDDFLKDKTDGFQQWFDQTSGDIQSYFIQTKEKVIDLENLYKDKLKLEAPAKYWNDRAKTLRKEGNRWLVGFIVSIVAGVGILVWVLNKIAEGTLTEIFTSTASAIKWSVALITLISFIAYAIRVISKLTFSSFHLVRDAEEREQLTYVYLALQKEKGIDQTERHLIMQSLFSRADTGLLKDDASPTMPGNIVDKFIQK
jgi:hypothetical protein